jgi:hypothetical protein
MMPIISMAKSQKIGIHHHKRSQKKTRHIVVRKRKIRKGKNIIKTISHRTIGRRNKYQNQRQYRSRNKNKKSGAKTIFHGKRYTKKRSHPRQNSYLWNDPYLIHEHSPSDYLTSIYTTTGENITGIDITPPSLFVQNQQHQPYVYQQYQDHNNYHYNDNSAYGTNAQLLIDTAKATLSSLWDISDTSEKISTLKENIIEFENEFNQLYPDSKLNSLQSTGKLVLLQLSKLKRELIDLESSITGGIKIKNILKNKAYCELISKVNLNFSPNVLETKIIRSFNELDVNILQNVIADTNAANNIDNGYFIQSTTIENLLHNNFFIKL